MQADNSGEDDNTAFNKIILGETTENADAYAKMDARTRVLCLSTFDDENEDILERRRAAHILPQLSSNKPTTKVEQPVLKNTFELISDIHSLIYNQDTATLQEILQFIQSKVKLS